MSMEKLTFTFKRFLGFLKLFIRNKRGMAGVAILLFYIIISFISPILTPFNDLGQDPDDPMQGLSSILAAPTWLRSLPSSLGGNPDLSENMLIKGLEGEFLNVTSPVVVENSSFGDPSGSGPGCFAVTFQREETGTTYGEVKVSLIREFDFPYSGRPRRFKGDIALFPNGTRELGTEEFRNKTTNEIEYRPRYYLDVTIEVWVYIATPEGEKWQLWPYFELGTHYYHPPRGFTVNRTKYFDQQEQDIFINKYYGEWIHSCHGESATSQLDSDSSEIALGVFEGKKDPTKTIFDKVPMTYIWGLEIVFIDEDHPEKPVEATLYIDDFDLLLHGSAFGVMGTDFFGQDLFSQLLHGTKISLYVGVIAAMLGVTIGLAVGLVSGYVGRLVDEGLMRIADVLLVIPTLPLLIVSVAILGTALEILILILGLLGWMGFARLVRSQVLTLRERSFIEAAKAVGSGKLHTITRHILPNVISLVYVNLATSVPGAIVAEASLAWLGFFDPSRMSWGRMLYENQAAGATGNWWWVIPPGLCIAALAVAFILIGYSLDEILNPRLRMRR